MTDHRTSIESNLQAFAPTPLRQASLDLLATLGYQSDKTIELEGSKPQAFLDFIKQHNPAAPFDQKKALFDEWQSADLLFQLTDAEISGEHSRFKDTDVKPSLLRSYLFFAIELTGSDYARGKLTAIARQLNRAFPMPVMVLIKHLADKQPVLSIAVINRRQNKMQAHNDVLEKTTIIRDIAINEPHRGHLDILNDLAFDNLVHPQKLPINNFDTLHTAWEQIFNVELLNNRFYKELSNWYFWALPQVEFPADLEPDDEKRRATSLIRLLTRLVFCWFLKEKGLIPDKLFHTTELAQILKGFDSESEDGSNYYQAILQNLFFATLNQRMGKDNKGEPYRKFARDEGFQKNRTTHDVNNLFRYEKHFAIPEEEALALFADIPFLNGGLFECLDRRDEDARKTRYLDGFSRTAKKRPQVPNRLFFGNEETADLSKAYGDNKRKKEPVTGLINILNGYKFTIVENTPIDQEIALDPELLGKVFENLLASYNEETKTTARKQTGSFYTPRPIVDYMVDESLKAHLTRVLVETADMQEDDAKEDIDHLFTYTEEKHKFIKSAQVAALITAIYTVKILDPACGSGAFPMGVLHKLVYILGKLDPGNERWKQTQLDAAQSIPDSNAREAAENAIQEAFQNNEGDYGRKLYLIQNCLYGVDIQPIAIQISKLRFFISLVCDQQTNHDKEDNHGIRPLPNLETKFVAANSLIGLPGMATGLTSQLEFESNPRIGVIGKEIENHYHSYFSIQRRQEKIDLQRKVKDLRKEMAGLLDQSGMSPKQSQRIAEWDAFDPQATADFFEPNWMFGISVANGFDIVIGNPPYGAKIAPHIRQLITRLYHHQNSSADSYLLFMEKAHQLLKPNGLVSYIVSNTWLPSLTFQKIRRFLTSVFTWRTLLVVRTKVFAAVVDTNVFLFEKSKPKATESLPVHFYTDEGMEFAHNLPWADIPKTGDAINVVFDPKAQALCRKMSGASRLLKMAANVYNGVKPFEKGKGSPLQTAETMRDKPFVAEGCPKPSGKNWMPLLRGNLINRFVTFWNNDSWIRYGAWLAAPRDPAIFEAPEKLFVRQTGDSIIATHGVEGFVARDNLHIILPKQNTNLLFLLGILNSRSIGFLYSFINPEKGEALAQVKKKHVEELPIPNATASEQKPIIEAVKSILTAKANNPAADTSTLEHEIDQHVYQLYQLTPDEIKTIEST